MSGDHTENDPFIGQDVESQGVFTEEQFGAPPASQPAGFLGLFHGAKHPVVSLFHVMFKAAALFIYLFGTWFTSNFVFLFVVCVLLLAFDFWTVKNVSGRLLVGLRWWSENKDDGTTSWRFESAQDRSTIDPGDSRVFWYSLWGAPICWGLLGTLALLKWNIEWMLVDCVGLALGVANLYGYIKCKKDADQRMQDMVADSVGKAMATGVASNMGSQLTGVLTSMLGGGGRR